MTLKYELVRIATSREAAGTLFLPSLAMIRRQVRKVTKLRFVSVIGLGFSVRKDGRYQGSKIPLQPGMLQISQSLVKSLFMGLVASTAGIYWKSGVHCGERGVRH